MQERRRDSLVPLDTLVPLDFLAENLMASMAKMRRQPRCRREGGTRSSFSCTVLLLGQTSHGQRGLDEGSGQGGDMCRRRD